MAPFIILFLYLGIVNLLTARMPSEINRRKYQTFWGGFGLWILLALRSWTCGNDLFDGVGYTGYIPYFLHFKSYSFKEVLTSTDGYERGYNILNWLIINLSENPQIFLAIIAAIELLLIGYTLYRHSPNIIFSWIIFACLGLYVFSFSGLRQALGISLCFFAFNFINYRKPYIFIFLVLLASTMHTSAYLFLPSLLTRNLHMDKNKAVLYLMMILAVSPFIMTIIQYASMFVYGKEKYASDAGGAYSLFILFISLFFYSFLYTRNKVKALDDISQVRWMILFAILLQSVGIFSAGALARIAYYFSIFFCLLLPMGLEFAPLKVRSIHSFIISVLFVIFFVISNSSGYLNVVPYRFFWEEQFNL